MTYGLTDWRQFFSYIDKKVITYFFFYYRIKFLKKFKKVKIRII